MRRWRRAFLGPGDESNVGYFARAFTLSNKIDQEQIDAELDNAVLTPTLKKAREAMPRRIAIA